MARPKKDHLPEEANLTEQVSAPETATVIQPAYVPPAPRQMQVERQGNSGSQVSRRFPEIRGGVCEFCGILDPNTPSQYQYKLCPHYRGLQARCSYCPESLDPDDVVYHEKLNVAEHPDNPGKIIMWCGKYECSKKHLERFQISN